MQNYQRCCWITLCWPSTAGHGTYSSGGFFPYETLLKKTNFSFANVSWLVVGAWVHLLFQHADPVWCRPCEGICAPVLFYLEGLYSLVSSILLTFKLFPHSSLSPGRNLMETSLLRMTVVSLTLCVYCLAAGLCFVFIWRKHLMAEHNTDLSLAGCH